MGAKRACVLLSLPVLLAAIACAPTDQGTTQPKAGASKAAASEQACAPSNLPLQTSGQLTVATDSPAYPPWFVHNDPSNGKGYESAVAYAVARQLGFSDSQVTWVKEPFNNSYAPGPKNFDFDINQISITPARAKVVDFSDGYYQAAQAVIALKKSKAASATSLADLTKLKLGAQTGTTSLEAITNVIKPDSQPLVFQDTNAAKQALLNGQVDAILTDLPTAFYITAVQIPHSTIVGQFQPVTGRQEEFGMLFEKGSTLVPCVNQALATLKQRGTLDQLQQRWLSEVVNVPVLK
ncbi:MAG TPA: transporter substrate-binding domain-containing protein [Nocardioidaceae bacterium]|nr:transporter substrate-binding domain-containing protein [Nocardioidaceae bacterium]